MYHEDGIEVYLKPLGPLFDVEKFREIPQQNDETDPFLRKCTILDIKSSVAIVIKLRECFNMANAKCLQLGIGIGIGPRFTDSRYFVCDRLTLEGRHIVFNPTEPVSLKGFNSLYLRGSLSNSEIPSAAI